MNWHTIKAILWQLLFMACVAVAAHMGWLGPEGVLLGLFNLGGGHRTSSSDSRVAVTDQGVVTQGGGQTALGDNPVTIGARANVGGVNVSGGGRGSNTDVSITTSDPDLLRDALLTVENVVGSFRESLEQGNQGFTSAVSSLSEGVLAKLTELAESKQTDGEAKRDMVIMWIALGLFAVIGIFFWRRR